MFAEQLHRRSKRSDRAFVKLNCAAVPEALLEGELFGYEKGAFTGATQSKAGLFEMADGGTVLLDEIGEVPVSVQAKLLRALETGEIQRLGSVKSRVVDVRVVSATNRDLRSAITAGLFRSDLYFRLSGMTITLPPLRERVLDVTPLAEQFMARVSTRLGRSTPVLGNAARAALDSYRWPGNVRELKNTVERAVVMCHGDELLAEHLMLAEDDEWPTGPMPILPATGPAEGSFSKAEPKEAGGGGGAFRFRSGAEHTPTARKLEFESKERQTILDALEKTAGNQSQAAKLLGITRRALIYRLERYEIARPRKR